MKYILNHPNLCRQTYWDLKDVFKEIITRRNTFLPEIGFSHKHKLLCVGRGAFRYLLLTRRESHTGTTRGRR